MHVRKHTYSIAFETGMYRAKLVSFLRVLNDIFYFVFPIFVFILKEQLKLYQVHRHKDNKMRQCS